ncbi:nuclear pore protein 84/107 [Kockovaella imperatae]|uniref:Nuclear pore complex protein n=1 Tax=Kockovaella imperatae TaxID=4999 RepID=A0A1Y1URR9_9TREE|nr:nuclear pore protein 84/107 [Kockovaella imperatae]ORX40632.1 nuclear pore protein 84/107 [Kockovaella imperatae]
MAAAPSSHLSASQSFAKVFSSYHEQYAEAGPSSAQLDTPIRYDVVLDEEGGLVTSLMGTLEQAIIISLTTHRLLRELAASDDGEMTDDLKDALMNEHRTWQLVRAVYDVRLHRADPAFVRVSAKAHLAQNPYSSPEELTQYMVNEDSELSLLAMLVDHLQTRTLLDQAPPLEARHGYLPATIRRAKATMLSATHRQNPSLDPDFTLRDPHGSHLAGEDQTYQVPLLETLWDLVRHGELDQALKICEEGGEPWRAASLMGGRRWSMGGMTQDSTTGPLEGNRTRNLWKKSCRAIATNPTLSTAERRLYGALITHLPTLLPACETWEDHLWAHSQAMMESRLDQKWKDLAGFWEQQEQVLGVDDGSQVIQGGIDDIFARLDDFGREDIHSSSLDPYRVAQRMVIQGRADLLLDQFATRLPEIDTVMAPELIAPLVRFFSHLVLLLRTLGQPVPDGAANLILEKYLSILRLEGNDSLVAMYAACLREGSGEESYARFLRGMDPNATREAKYEALNRAKLHNLDIAVIVTQTVRMILQEAFASIPALRGDQPDPTHLRTGLDERDVFLIRSLEWLTMVPDTADEALVQSNAVARYFLALGQTHAAQSLFRSLPAGISTIAEDEDGELHALEHDHFQQLFNVYACHDLVDEVLARSPKATATKTEHFNWRKSLITAIDKTENATVTLLTCDWFRFDLRAEQQRMKELERIRQIFVPDLTVRLHDLLVAHKAHQPILLQRALDLSKVVAAEEYHVYQEFFGRSGGDPYRLSAYLERIREASLEALKSGSGAAFVVKA